MSDRLRKALLIVAGIIILALAILLTIQSIYLIRLEYDAQIAQFGFYKDDIHVLEYRYQIITPLCLIGAVLSYLGGGSAAFVGVMS